MHSRFTTPVLAALALVVLPAAANAQAHAAAPTWGPAPAVFPAGAKMAVLQGDPSKPGLFTVRLELPDGYRVQPHLHGAVRIDVRPSGRRSAERASIG